MRRAIAVVVAVLVTACARPSPEPEPGPKAGGAWGGSLPQSKELAGVPVKETKDGPWTVRAAVSSSPAAGDDKADRGFATADGAAMPAPGGPPAERFALAEESGGEMSGSPAPTASPAADGAEPAKNQDPGSPLRAGASDDNEDLDGFVKFLAEWGDRPEIAGNYDLIDVRDRRFVRVVNREGKPVPGTEVRITDEAADKVVLLGTTYGDGRVPFYPHAAEKMGGPVPAAFSPAGSLVVEVQRGAAKARTRWDGKGAEFTVTVEEPKPVVEPVALDVLFLIDTTGSMGDEIDRIKESLLAMTQKLRSLGLEFDLRYSAVLYRDLGDEYVTKAHPFTKDIQEFDAALKSVVADGGGDGPESVNQGLAEAVGRSDWRPDAAKVMFLIADAEPHMDYAGDVRYGESLKAALAKGIRIHAVAASGLDEVGSVVFRQIAQFTRGKFIFIEYGTVEASAAAHGITGEVKSNNLDDILYTQIRDEIARYGR